MLQASERPSLPLASACQAGEPGCGRGGKERAALWNGGMRGIVGARAMQLFDIDASWLYSEGSL